MNNIEIIGYSPTTYQMDMHNAVINGDWKEYYFILSRQSGKSFWALNQILYYNINQPNFFSAYITPTYKLAKKVFRDFKNLLKDIPIIENYNQSELIIFFKNGSQLQFFSAENPIAIRGNTFDFVVIDEGAFMDDDFYEQIIKPTLLIRNGKMVCITTPKGRNWVYVKYNIGQNNNNSIYSLKKTIYENELISKQQIETIIETTPKHIFEIEFLCNFDVLEDVLFSEIEQRVLSNAPITNSLFAGIDLGRINDYSVCVIINQSGQMIDYMRINKQSWSLITQKLIAFSLKYKLQSGLIEVNNVGDVIAEDIISKNDKFEIFKTTTQSKNPLIENLILSWDNNTMTILDDEIVKKEFEVFSFKFSNTTRNIQYSAPSGLHDDIIIATSLAHWAKKININKGKYVIA